MKEETKKEVKEELPKEELKEERTEEKEEVEEVVEDINQENEIETLKNEIARLKNAYALAYADTENMKKRLQSEADTMRKYRIQSFALEILPVIDNFERALKDKDEEDSYVKGFKMIYEQLIKALHNEGVEEIDCLNKPFDPNFQQAIMQEKKEGVESGIVIEIFQKGYKLKDRILRAAMVKVSE